MKKNIFILSILALSVILISFNIIKAQTTPEINLKGWAWSSNIGWISFNSANQYSGGMTNGDSYSVQISTTTSDTMEIIGYLSGHAWSPNIGWISFDGSETGTPPSDDTGNGVSNIAQVNMTTGKVIGWARALSGNPNTGWDGWIHLSDSSSPIPKYTSPDFSGIDNSSVKGITFASTTGLFTGFSWGSDVVGWLNWNITGSIDTDVHCDPVESCLITPPTEESFSVICDSPQTVSKDIPAIFTATPIGGTPPYYYYWQSDYGEISSSTEQDPYITYSSTSSASGFPGPTITAIAYDTNGNATTTSATCNNVVVTEDTAIDTNTSCSVPQNSTLCDNSTTTTPGPVHYLRNNGLCQSSSTANPPVSLRCEYQCESGFTLRAGQCVNGSEVEL